MLLMPEPSDADPTKGREDVRTDVAFVAPVGAGSEVQLLGWQPLAGEIGAEVLLTVAGLWLARRSKDAVLFVLGLSVMTFAFFGLRILH